MNFTQFWNQLRPNEFILVNEDSEAASSWFDKNKDTIWRIEDQGSPERRLLWST
jgi:hypothetical protein